VNKLEKCCFILLIILFGASDYWLHEEFFGFLPDSSIIPSVELFSIFSQVHVFQVFSEASQDSFYHFFNIECFSIFFWDSIFWIACNIKNYLRSNKWFYPLRQILEFFNVDAFLCFWELGDETIVSNETWCFNWDLRWLSWFLNDLLDLLDSCWWCLVLYGHFTSHGGTCGGDIFVLMNCSLFFVAAVDNLFVLNLYQHHSQIGQLLSLLGHLVVLVKNLGGSTQI